MIELAFFQQELASIIATAIATKPTATAMMETQMVGQGGYGAVHAVGSHAVKVIDCTRSDAQQTFSKECRIGMELRHPNIVR